MDNTFPDSLLKLRRNTPDGSACLRAGAEFVKDHLDIPGTLSIFKVGRVGDGHLGLGPLSGNDDEVAAGCKVSRTHQRDQDMSAGKFGKNTFYGIVRKRRRLKAECRRAFRYKTVLRSVACGPVIMFGGPGSHIGRCAGMGREARYDHGKDCRPAAISVQRIPSAVGVIRPSAV